MDSQQGSETPSGSLNPARTKQLCQEVRDGTMKELGKSIELVSRAESGALDDGAGRMPTRQAGLFLCVVEEHRRYETRYAVSFATNARTRIPITMR